MPLIFFYISVPILSTVFTVIPAFISSPQCFIPIPPLSNFTNFRFLAFPSWVAQGKIFYLLTTLVGIEFFISSPFIFDQQEDTFVAHHIASWIVRMTTHEFLILWYSSPWHFLKSLCKSLWQPCIYLESSHKWFYSILWNYQCMVRHCSQLRYQGPICVWIWYTNFVSNSSLWISVQKVCWSWGSAQQMKLYGSVSKDTLI